MRPFGTGTGLRLRSPCPLAAAHAGPLWLWPHSPCCRSGPPTRSGGLRPARAPPGSWRRPPLPAAKRTEPPSRRSVGIPPRCPSARVGLMGAGFSTQGRLYAKGVPSSSPRCRGRRRRYWTACRQAPRVAPPFGRRESVAGRLPQLPLHQTATRLASTTAAPFGRYKASHAPQQRQRELKCRQASLNARGVDQTYSVSRLLSAL